MAPLTRSQLAYAFETFCDRGMSWLAPLISAAASGGMDLMIASRTSRLALPPSEGRSTLLLIGTGRPVEWACSEQLSRWAQRVVLYDGRAETPLDFYGALMASAACRRLVLIVGAAAEAEWRQALAPVPVLRATPEARATVGVESDVRH